MIEVKIGKKHYNLLFNIFNKIINYQVKVIVKN